MDAQTVEEMIREYYENLDMKTIKKHHPILEKRLDLFRRRNIALERMRQSFEKVISEYEAELENSTGLTVIRTEPIGIVARELITALEKEL